MDHELFTSVIRNLLHVNVTRPHAAQGAYTAFEEKYCYSPALQPMFTAMTLSRLIGAMENNIIYEAEDRLGVSILFFRVEGEPYIVGPLVRQQLDMKKAHSALIAAKMPAAVASSVRLYYSAFPLLGLNDARSAVVSCIRAFTGSSEDYSFYRMENVGDNPKPPRTSYSESLDYSAVYRSYDRENRFLRAIEEGDTERVLIAYDEMIMNTAVQTRYINAIYMDPSIALAMVRAMSRKSAERGGVSPIEINEITQRAVQKMFSLRDRDDQIKCSFEMILELTEAVKHAKLSLGKYSAPVKKIVEYIHLNYSQKISPTQLAELAGLSDTYISKAFRKEVGTTISHYIARLRCDEAAKMLRESDATVQEISEYVGYADNNYFVKVFKSQYGVTPTDYRAGAV